MPHGQLFICIDNTKYLDGLGKYCRAYSGGFHLFFSHVFHLGLISFKVDSDYKKMKLMSAIIQLRAPSVIMEYN